MIEDSAESIITEKAFLIAAGPVRGGGGILIIWDLIRPPQMIKLRNRPTQIQSLDWDHRDNGISCCGYYESVSFSKMIDCVIRMEKCTCVSYTSCCPF